MNSRLNSIPARQERPGMLAAEVPAGALFVPDGARECVGR
ncbi:MAG: hypothetical protein CMLOHMNK_00863 [Steroidobacteraceae bacterium]|nr:hypothetical protein [Steroidobacteraceae bacterium]